MRTFFNILFALFGVGLIVVAGIGIHSQDVMDANLPMCVTIPADMPDEEVPIHLMETFGYPVLAWQDNF